MSSSCLINQCQIITFLILKSDNIENSRMELRGIVSTLQYGTFVFFFLFHIENVGGIFGGGGGGQRVCCPSPSQIIGVGS